MYISPPSSSSIFHIDKPRYIDHLPLFHPFLSSNNHVTLNRESKMGVTSTQIQLCMRVYASICTLWHTHTHTHSYRHTRGRAHTHAHRRVLDVCMHVWTR